ncbi:MAG: formate/nitrite transporter family protein [Gemmatimonadales bacterium]|nr:MAG: formate/nitrite transporter family protein [Gemmatimonadales bacterium]
MTDPRDRWLLDAYAPAEMAQKVLRTGVSKANLSVSHTLALSVLAGAFIAMGAAFATLAMTQTGLGLGPTRLLGGLTFSLGLILVVVAGAELFTGNNLVAMAWASRAITSRLLIRNWVLVYAGNLLGALGSAALVFWSGVWASSGHAAGLTAIAIAVGKTELGFGEAFVRGVLCNALVCLAVWLCHSARSTTDKILAVVWPISAFVALGFEHSIANMYFVPYAILLASDGGVSAISETQGVPLESLDLSGLIGNLVPVTLGNVAGGTLLVAAIYWFVYLRGAETGEGARG